MRSGMRCGPAALAACLLAPLALLGLRSWHFCECMGTVGKWLEPSRLSPAGKRMSFLWKAVATWWQEWLWRSPGEPAGLWLPV